MNYDDRLKLLGLERLELRRLHTDLITCYKIINDLVPVQFDLLFKFAVNTNTRGHSLKLVTGSCKRPCACLSGSCRYCVEQTAG